MHSYAHTPESIYIVRPQYEFGMYKVTQSSQQSLLGSPATAAQQVTACLLSYSTSVHHVHCRAAMPHLLCCATQN